MATVTGIETLRGRVCVRVDGAELARVRKAHFDLCPLKEGDAVDPEAWLDRIAALQAADAYEAALTSLDARDRTQRDIAATLRRGGYVEPVIEATVRRLRESGLVDDARFARRMAERQSAKPAGIRAVRRRLMARGIRGDDAEAALEVFDDDQQREACLAAARSLWRRYADLPPRQAKSKLGQALARRGFNWDAIESAVERLTE